MGSSKTTDTRQPGAQSGEAQRIMAALAEQVQRAGGQMGDLSSLAAGQMEINPYDRALVQQAQESTGQVAQQQMDQNMEQILRQLQDQAIGRGIENSSLEAVNNALVGQDYQRQMQQMMSQLQGQSAQALMNMPFQRAGVQLNANQALMQRLVGGAQPALGYDQGIRQMGMTSTRESPFDFGALMNTAIGTGGQIAKPSPPMPNVPG